MKKNKHRILISKNGKVTFIYDDELAGLLGKGIKASITRVSNVEPCDGGWSATMVDDGTVLGPFPLRQQALEAEIAYLEQKLFGVK